MGCGSSVARCGFIGRPSRSACTSYERPAWGSRGASIGRYGTSWLTRRGYRDRGLVLPGNVLARAPEAVANAALHRVRDAVDEEPAGLLRQDVVAEQRE